MTKEFQPLSLEGEQTNLIGKLCQLGRLQTQGKDVTDLVLETERRLCEIAEAKADIGRLFKLNTHHR